MKNGQFVIRWKESDYFFSSGSYHKPSFDGFLVACTFSTQQSAVEAAQLIQQNKSIARVLQIVRISNLPTSFDLFEGDDSVAGDIQNLLELLTKLGDTFVLSANHDLNGLHAAVVDTQRTVLVAALSSGVSLAGDDVVAEVEQQR